MSSKGAAHRMVFGSGSMEQFALEHIARQGSIAHLRIGANQRKVLLLLYAGALLPTCVTPKRTVRVVGHLRTEWQMIDRDVLNQAIRGLYRSQLVEVRSRVDGSTSLVLSKNGRNCVLTYDIDRMKITTPQRWDKKWRVALFDVPETERRTRAKLREHFKKMGFFEFQKSVFVHPYPCAKEIEFLTEFYGARRYLRFMVASEIDNEEHLLKHFEIKPR